MARNYIARTKHAQACSACGTDILAGDPCSMWMWQSDDDGLFRPVHAHEACGAAVRARGLEEWGPGAAFSDDEDLRAAVLAEIAAARPPRMTAHLLLDQMIDERVAIERAMAEFNATEPSAAEARRALMAKREEAYAAAGSKLWPMHRAGDEAARREAASPTGATS